MREALPGGYFGNTRAYLEKLRPKKERLPFRGGTGLSPEPGEEIRLGLRTEYAENPGSRKGLGA